MTFPDQEFDTSDSNNFGNDNGGGDASDVSRETSEQTTGSDELLDLSTVDRFRYGDKEYTREQFERERMLQSDYTKKTQELAQERKYYSNLQADLDQVARNPQLVAEFKKLYPPQFHAFLKFTGGNTVSRNNTSTNGANGNNRPAQNANEQQLKDPRLDELLSWKEKFEEQQKEQIISQRESEIDAAFTKFSSKYPLATPDGMEAYVLAHAEKVLAQKPGDQKALSEKDWEGIFKTVHTRVEKAYGNTYKQKINSQTNANIRGREAGRGGGVPGQAANAPRTIKDATALARRDIESGKFTR